MAHPLVEQLSDPDANVRRGACRAVPSDPSAVLLLEAVVAVLGDPEPDVAQAASDALAAIGRDDATLVPKLEAALRGQDREARWWAALTLSRLAPPRMKLLPVLLDGLEHAEGSRRWAAAKLVVELGRSEGEVLPVLLHFVESEERPALRRMAVFALRELAPDRPETTRALLTASRCEDAEVRRAAFSALAVVFEGTGAACKRLVEVLGGDVDPASRALAANALGALLARGCAGTEAAHGALEAASRDDAFPAVRLAAGAVLERA